MDTHQQRIVMIVTHVQHTVYIYIYIAQYGVIAHRINTARLQEIWINVK